MLLFCLLLKSVIQIMLAIKYHGHHWAVVARLAIAVVAAVAVAVVAVVTIIVAVQIVIIIIIIIIIMQIIVTILVIIIQILHNVSSCWLWILNNNKSLIINIEIYIYFGGLNY